MSGPAVFLTPVASLSRVRTKTHAHTPMASLFFPVLGVVLSNALYLSSAPAVLQASRRGSLGSLNPLPLALMAVSTVSWMCYALAVPNGFILASNLPGAVAAFAFVAITLPLIPPEAAAARRGVTLVLSGGAATMLTLWTYLIFAKVEHDRLVFLLGAYASLICVLLFASPLSTVREVAAPIHVHTGSLHPTSPDGESTCPRAPPPAGRGDVERRLDLRTPHGCAVHQLRDVDGLWHLHR